MSKRLRSAAMLPVDGVEQPTAEERTFAAVEPSTGEVLWQVPDAGQEDVVTAATAARRALLETPWSTDTKLRVAVPIWRDPWMVVGASTYTDDLLARAGLVNVLSGSDGRYPTVTTDDIDDAGADVVLLPDEPYVFTESDGPEALRTPTRLVSGRLLTWYGPAMVESHAMLATIAG